MSYHKFLLGLILVLLATAPRLRAQDLYEYLQHRVNQISESTQEDLATVTPDQWPQTKERWRGQLREMLGIPEDLDRTDLQVARTGEIQLEGVRVQRLHYQARPGFYVTANLYLPDQSAPEEGWPAVLYVCGHARATDFGRLVGNKTGYQHHGLWLARHGFVCLMIDTIQLGEFHGEHHGTYKLGRWDWFSRGYTPAGVEAWNAIRGVDLLCGLEQVDENRIGITGRSGGGAYSWFAAALDERIRVAIPVAGITDLQNHVIDGCVEGHCDCMYFVNYYGWDYAKLAALVAPRALLLENSDSDGIFPLDGVVRIDRAVRNLYERLDASEKYGLVITPGPHKDTQDLRVPAFRFLMKHLQGKDYTIDQPALKEIEPTELVAFERETPRKERVTSAAGWFAPEAKSVAADEAWDEFRQTWLPMLQERGVLPRRISSESFPQRMFAELRGEPGPSLLDFSEGGQLLVEPSSTGKERVVAHLILEANRWEDAAAVMDSDFIQRRIRAIPEAQHVFFRWSLADWKSQAAPTVKGENQVVRRFYLVGETPEQLALKEFLAALAWLSRGTLTGLELAGTGREAFVVSLSALFAEQSEEIQNIDRVYFGSRPSDLQLASTVMGLMQICTVEDVHAALESTTEVRSAPLESSTPALLVDSSSEPQQATGMRVVEVSQDQATVWVRATRYSLPNLGDLPEVEFREHNGKQSSGAILPEQGVDGLRFAVPGVAAWVRAGLRGSGDGEYRFSEWTQVDSSTDYSRRVTFDALQPSTSYSVRTQVKASEDGPVHTMTGSFQTLPSADKSSSFRLAVGTCQGFTDRDGPHGFDLYRSMLRRGTDAFVMAGDVVYYDRLARSNELAYYHWQRTYSLPTLVEFHRRVPTYFLKDDHDTYVNDSWPGERRAWTDDFTFEEGQRIFIEQTGLPTPAYRSFKIGKDLQVWMMEGRDFRSPNSDADGPGKTIWGAEQKAWLKRTLDESTAKFKVVISPTPIVGPDRANKKDNHSNRVFETEGKEIREMLASSENTIAVCGDRHWQFHSVDPETGLHEFSVGPASDRHAGGWKKDDFRPEIHRYLRVAGGYLEIELSEGEEARLVVRHLDTQGNEQHRHVLE